MPSMYSPMRALLRRVALGHILANAIIWAAAAYYGYLNDAKMTSFSTLLLIAANLPFVALAVDAIGVTYYLRKLNSSAGIQTVKEVFLWGITWNLLRQMVLRAKEFDKTVEEAVKLFPALKQDQEFTDAIVSADSVTISMLLEREGRKAAAAAKETERRERKKLLANAELDTLCAAARKLGVRDAQLTAARENGAPALRTLIAKKEEEQRILRESEGAGCKALVQTALESGGIKAAEASLIVVKRLRERAAACGGVLNLDFYIANRDLSQADASVAAEENRYKCRQVAAGLRKRLSKLPAPSRPEIERQIAALGLLKYDSREFRKELHAIEQKLPQ